MSRGGPGGGRGRGRGANKSFSREQLSSLGVSGSEIVPGPVTQPPALFPMLDHKPIGLTISNEMKYKLMLKQEFVDSLKESPAFIKPPRKETSANQDGLAQIAKLLSQLPNARNSFNWAFLPSELRPKVAAKKMKRTLVRKVKVESDIQARLDTLERLESTVPTNVSIKEEQPEVEEDEEVINDEEEDEEMDDGTDYANNYFDNGEGYDDEDDNLDDGPIY